MYGKNYTISDIGIYRSLKQASIIGGKLIVLSHSKRYNFYFLVYIHYLKNSNKNSFYLTLKSSFGICVPKQINEQKITFILNQYSLRTSIVLSNLNKPFELWLPYSMLKNVNAKKCLNLFGLTFNFEKIITIWFAMIIQSNEA